MEIELAFVGFWKDPYVNKYAIFCIYFYIFIFSAIILFSIIKNTYIWCNIMIT